MHIADNVRLCKKLFFTRKVLRTPYLTSSFFRYLLPAFILGPWTSPKNFVVCCHHQVKKYPILITAPMFILLQSLQTPLNQLLPLFLISPLLPPLRPFFDQFCLSKSSGYLRRRVLRYCILCQDHQASG